jgi:hypothetical protein
MPKSVPRRHVNGLTTGRANSERGKLKCGAVSLRSCTTAAKKICVFDPSIEAEEFRSRSTPAFF